MVQSIQTVVIPAAGRGTRLLPATKATSKELLNVYDRSTIQFAINEAIELGVKRIVVVIHPDKGAIRDYLSPNPDYIMELRRSGKTMLATALEDIEVPGNIEILFAKQEQPLGLGHAVLCAGKLLLPGPFAIVLPDDLILGTSCLSEMAMHYEEGHMIAAMEVSRSETKSYGIFRLAAPGKGPIMRVSGMIEKPAPDQAPSQLAAVGRYILDPAILETLKETSCGAGGEIQLTDAIEQDSKYRPLSAFRFSGIRYDCGCHDGLLSAAIARQGEVKSQIRADDLAAQSHMLS